METDQQHAGDDAAKHGNVLQANNSDPTPVNEISQLLKTSEIRDDKENSQPIAPEDDGIKYSENVVPAEEDENSDQENLKPTSADIGVELQEKKKKRKKKSKSKRGLVTFRIAPNRYWANVNHGAEGEADRFRGVLC